jgi:hypothetical protein
MQNPDSNKRDLVLVKMNVRCFDYTEGWSIRLYNPSGIIPSKENSIDSRKIDLKFAQVIIEKVK